MMRAVPRVVWAPSTRTVSARTAHWCRRGGESVTPRPPGRARCSLSTDETVPARDAMFSFLRALGLQPIEWAQARAATGKASYIRETLDAAFEQRRRSWFS